MNRRTVCQILSIGGIESYHRISSFRLLLGLDNSSIEIQIWYYIPHTPDEKLYFYHRYIPKKVIEPKYMEEFFKTYFEYMQLRDRLRDMEVM